MVAAGRAPLALPLKSRQSLREDPSNVNCKELVHAAPARQQTKSKVLVLDVDETLVHTIVGVRDELADILLSLPCGPASVFKRPGVENFLLTVSEHYEIWLWSSGSKPYIDALLSQWQTLQNVVCGRYKTGDDCCERRGRTPKPLFHFEDQGHCDMKDIVLVDNFSDNFTSQESNCIKVKDFTKDDASDDTLEQLSPILDELIDVDDVRTVLPTLDPPSASDEFGLLMREKCVVDQVRGCKGTQTWTDQVLAYLPCGSCRGCSLWLR